MVAFLLVTLKGSPSQIKEHKKKSLSSLLGVADLIGRVRLRGTLL